MEFPAAELKPGTRLFGYEVLGLLAQGGMAEVYLARKGASPPVVLKRIRPNLVEDPQFVGMFLDEARLAQLLNHPNVVKVLDVGQDGSNYALAMEFLDGRNLLRVARACYQRRAYVPYELMARIMADSLAGLEHAHTQKGADGRPLNLVHRDMSPENIVVTYDGKVKVVDFGIAKAANMEGRTQAGVIKGKLGYVPPEAISGDKLDGRADIFAMGVTLYELLTYTVPFAGQNEVEVLTAISTREPQPPRQLNPSVPVELETICMKALDKNRQRRWQTAAEMRQSLEHYMRSTGKGTTAAYLGAFMEALFPRGTDKERLRVAGLMAVQPAFGNPESKVGGKGAPRAAAAGRKASSDAVARQAGPAWSKSLQAEEIMGGGPAPSNASTPARRPPPMEATADEPLVEAGGTTDENATQASEMDAAMLAELRGAKSGAGRSFDDRTSVEPAPTRDRDELADEDDPTGGFLDLPVTDATQANKPAPRAPPPSPPAASKPPAPAPRAPARAAPAPSRPAPPKPPPPPPVSSPDNPVISAGQGMDFDVDPVSMVASDASLPPVPGSLPPPPAPPPPLDLDPPSSGIDDDLVAQLAPPPRTSPGNKRTLDVAPELADAVARAASGVAAPTEEEATDEDLPLPPPVGMHPLVATFLGFLFAAVLTTGAAAGLLYTGTMAVPPQVHLPDALGFLLPPAK